MKVSSNQEICISGIAGKFPNSADIEEHATNLLNGVNEIEEASIKSQSTPRSMSESVGINFYGIDSSQVMNMNIVSRNLVECAYDAIFDSGVNPSTLCKTHTGVFVGTCAGDQSSKKGQNLLNLSTSRSNKNQQLANDVCSVLQLKGPIHEIQNECCSTLVSLDIAIKAIEAGQCNQAIVCGIDMNDSKIPMTIGCLFLQKRQDCRRIYASLLDSKISVKNNLSNTLKEMYINCNLDPSQVLYVENYCERSDEEVEKELVNSLVPSNINRHMPLYIGSNMIQNNAQQMTGITALVRMIVSIQRQVLPANKTKPISLVSESHVAQKVQKNIPLIQNGLMALNASCNNNNIHILMRPQSLQESSMVWMNPIKKIPTLFTIGARTTVGVQKIIEKVKQHPTDLAAQILLEDIITQKQEVDRTCRGFCVLNSDQPKQELEEIKCVPQIKKPVFYIFNGITTEWQEICEEMMHIQAFNQSIQNSAKCLKQNGYDLVRVLSQGKQEKKPLDSIVAITAMQMALVDCLSQAGIKPDGLIGHSVGELTCAYADNALTAEETIQAAYQRGKCIQDANLPAGGMAIVGLSWEEAQQICPKGVFPSSNNEEKNVTISGIKKDVENFVQQLKLKGISAEEIDSSNLSLCSDSMTSIAPQMKSALEKVIINPKRRSSKWISTSIPEQRWKSDISNTASANYLVNSLVSHVYFKEALQHIPSNALVIDIGPSQVLDNIVKNSIGSEAVQIPSMAPSLDIAYPQITLFWTNLGKLYIEGAQEQPMNMLIPNYMSNQKLYPVPVNTGFISDIAKLTYSDSTQNPVHSRIRRSVPEQIITNSKCFLININNNKDSYLIGHKINGICVLPVSSLICMAWETLAEMNDSSLENLPVQLTDIECGELIQLHQNCPVNLTVHINSQDGCFKILKNDSMTICNGKIETLPRSQQQKLNRLAKQTIPAGVMSQNKTNIYRALKQLGHDLSGEFETLISTNSNCTNAMIEWTSGHWVALLDGMMQMNVLRNKQSHSEIDIKCVRINPEQLISLGMITDIAEPEMWSQQDSQHSQRLHDESFEILSLEVTDKHPIKNVVKRLQNQQISHNWSLMKSITLPLIMNPNTSTINCPGVEMIGISCGKNVSNLISKDTEFVSYMENNISRLDSIGLMAENNCSIDMQTKEIFTNYLSECKDLASLILMRIRNPIMTVQPTTLQQIQNMKSGKVLQLLADAAMLPVENGQHYLHVVRKLFFDNLNMFRAVQEDEMLNSLPYDCNLKALVDTVLENTNCGQNRRLRVLDISSSFNHCYTMKLDRLMKNNYPDCHVDYKFVSLFKNPNLKNILSYLNQQLTFSVEKVDWEWLENDRLNMRVPNILKDFDLVLFNTTLQILTPHCQSIGELQNWLQNCIRQTLKPQGFVMVHEFTNQNMTELCMLEQVVCENKSLVHQGELNHIHKIRSESEWREIIEEVGLIPVSVKNDRTMSTVCLFRNECHITQSAIEYVDIDQQEWLENCQQIIRRPEIKRLLLVSESIPDSRVLDLITELRESQGGQKVRCLFATDKHPINAACLPVNLKEQRRVGHLSFHNEKLLQLIIKADLFMNIFNNGKWGSLHSGLSQSWMLPRQNVHLQRGILRGTLSNIQDNCKLLSSQEPLLMSSMQETSYSHGLRNPNIRYLMPRQCIEKLNQISMVNHQVPVVIIHPIEGHVNMLKNLAQLIKYPVLGVQYTKREMECHNIRQLADHYWREIEQQIGHNKRIHLGGYGLGAMIALEMAEMNAEKCASIILLDSGKSCVNVNTLNMNKNILSSMRDSEKIRTEALFNFATRYLQDINKFELMRQLMNCNSLDQQIKLVVREMMENSQFIFDQNDLIDAACSYVKKCQMMEEQEPISGMQLNSEVILIKPNNNYTELDNLLAQMINHTEIRMDMVEKHTIGCDARSLLEKKNCHYVAGIINETLIKHS